MRFAFHLRRRPFICTLLAVAAGLLVAATAPAQEDPLATVEGAAEQPTEVNADELIKQGEAALNEGNYQEALELFEKLARGVEQSPQLEYQARVLLLSMAYTGRARALAGLREFEAAEEDYNRVLTDQPNFMPALLGIGQMYLEMGAADQALSHFESAVKLQRGNLAAQFGLGKAYVQLGGYQQAIAPLTRVIEAQPENAEAYRLRGTAQAGVLKYPEAIADLQQAITLNPDDYESHFMLGVVYLRMEDYARSAEALGEAIAHYQPKPGEEGQPFLQGYLTRASVFIELGKSLKDDESARMAAYQSAVDETEKALSQLDEKNPYTAGARAAALYSHGVGERMLGNLGEAIQSFSQAIELNPEMAEAYYRRGICFHRIGEDRMAIADFAESANINFEDPRANLWEGYTHAKLGEYHEAIRAYGNAIAASDRYAPAYMNRGLAYMALGEHEKAIADFDDAIRLEPANADYYFKRGMAYKLLGEHERASSSFANAVEFDPTHEAAHRHLADVLQTLGDAEQAREYRQKAAELASTGQ